jgi:hypothetical protein
MRLDTHFYSAADYQAELKKDRYGCAKILRACHGLPEKVLDAWKRFGGARILPAR